ncbi:MAG: DUF6776 family protein [Betaproteobacteria bacterium]
MANPAVTLRIKRFRQRFGITAPRVSVRTHFGWHWYIAGVALIVVAVAAVVWWLAQREEVVHMEGQMSAMSQRMTEMESELTLLRSQAGTEQSAVRVERTAQQQLLARFKALEQENASLKEDIALFERLVPADGLESSIRIERLGVVSGAEPGRFRYRLLVGFQPSKQEKEFRGRLQLTVLATQGGKEIQLNLPSNQEADGEYLVEVRHFLRKEGGFALPAGAKIKSLEARLMQGGVLKAKQLANY